jgi:ABC-2 type transport system permease protein
MQAMRSVLASPIRASAFWSKEIYEVLRQPGLIMTLALGPFLILLLFGIGFNNTPRPFRTLFVAPESDTVRQQIEQYATTLGSQLVYQGITPDVEAAKTQLRQGQIDLVIVVPTDAESTIRNSQQAVFTLFHNEIDPLQASYVDYFGQIYVSELNRRLVQQIMTQGQTEAATVQDDVAAAHLAATATRVALEREDAAAARQSQDELDTHVSALEVAVGASIGVLRGVEASMGESSDTSTTDELLAQLEAVRTGTNALDNVPDNGDFTAEAAQAAAVEAQLAELETTLSEFTGIAPDVIVSPFRSEAHTVANIAPDVTSFFAPGVLALLLQHVAVTFGALSLVRERNSGTVELFRVSPITAGEVLAGKYLSYMLFGGLLAAVLTLLLRYALGVPMVGSWWYFGLVLALLLFAALGIGFVISLISSSDSQAVQLSMLVLLAAVFFSGIFTSLYLLIPAVRAVSWLIPVTYGIQLLQTVMLRGAVPDWRLLSGLLLIGLVMFVIAWILTQRLMARR